MKTKETKQPKQKGSKKSKICSDYDSDCCKVPDHTTCFLGIMPCGTTMGIADGICPFIHNSN
jgi:hypothetical protein